MDTAPLGIALYAFVHDTLAPRITTAEVTDSVTLRVTFDRALQPEQPFSAAQVRLVGADSGVVPVRDLLRPAVADSLAQAAQAAQASAAALRDTTARQPTTPGQGPVVPIAPSLAPALGPGPQLRRPVPPLALVVRLGSALRPTTNYRITVREVRSLSGVVGTSDRTFTTPRPETASCEPPAERRQCPSAPVTT